MKIQFKLAFLCAVACSGFNSSAIAMDCTLPVDDTSWSVGAFSHDGTITAPHTAPWIFKKDGIVVGPGYWIGKWEKTSCRIVHATTTDVGGNTASFDVFFVTTDRLIVVDNNRLFRFGKRQ